MQVPAPSLARRQAEAIAAAVSPRVGEGRRLDGQLRHGPYLAVTVLAAAATFGLVWLWVAVAPLAFLDPEYPAWLAKQTLLQRCELGDVVLLGDSRPAADVIPAALPVTLTNLAVGGGKPIEAYAALSRALRCPNRPKRVMLSFDAVHFMRLDLFWERSVRFGFLDRADLAEVADSAAAVGDWPAFSKRQSDGLPASLRASLYALRFPGLYFNSVLRGGVFLRWWRNSAALQRGIADRGHYFFGTAQGSHDVAVEGFLPTFLPMPILDRYFDRLLDLLDRHGIEADFIAMPMNESTWEHVDPTLLAGYAAYLRTYAVRYPRFHLVGPVLSAWPDRLFGDEFAHLNPTGAALFSARLGPCLQARLNGAQEAPACDQRLHAAPPSTQNDAQ